ncbi:1508_t:CDS:2 [Paraglomus occultum]|uniref:1508_t:CDS:1 n=1 Tax=Paraglomus occultum TaxID=144539 RepID=A0A9N8ZAQ7_9GLOM|nr:1508_t:CDS:2 [Paraglomus occultum]
MLGIVFFSFQLTPQAYKNWRRKNTEGLSKEMMLIWALSAILFGAYAIILSLSIPLIIQPQIFCGFSLLCYVQCLYYDKAAYDNGSPKRILKYVFIYLIWMLILGGIQAAGVIGVRAANDKGITWVETTFGILPSVTIVIGFAPQYYEIYQDRIVHGISLGFVALDILGSVFSILSLAFRPPPLDILAAITFISILVADIIIVILHFLLRWVAKSTKKNLETKAKNEDLIKELKQKCTSEEQQAKAKRNLEERLRKVRDESSVLQSQTINFRRENECLLQKQKEMNEKISSLTTKLQIKDKKIKKWRGEALEYQAILGDTLNVNDDATTGISQIPSDTMSLIASLRQFCKFTKPVIVNEQTLNKMLSIWEIAKAKNRVRAKNQFSNAVQGDVIKFISSELTKYLSRDITRFVSYENPDHKLEHEIVSLTNQLTERVDRFLKVHNDVNKVRNLTAVKIRQLVYAVLAIHSFTDREHPFVKDTIIYLMQGMNKARELPRDVVADSENCAANIIRLCTSLFYFKLRATEPEAELVWLPKGAEFDDRSMVAVGATDEELDHARVEYCLFPMIRRPDTNLIMNPARVILAQADGA